MDSLTSKYRPRKLKQVVGQGQAIKTLSGMLNGHGLPPTLLLHGPRGVGKTSLARIIGRLANCESPSDGAPCEKCSSCLCAGARHPDIRELNAADDRGINMIRKLGEVARLAPRHKKKVIILDESQALTPQAYQAALKLFEEPPPTTTFILVTTHPQKMPDTIRSRCSKVAFKRVGAEPLSQFLGFVAKKEGVKLTKDNALHLATASGGHPREALTFLDQLLSAGVKPETVEAEIEKVTSSAPARVAVGFVKAVLDKNLKAAFRAGVEVEKGESLLAASNELLLTLILAQVDKGMVNPYLQKQMSSLGSPSLTVLTSVMKVFGTYLQQVRNFVLDDDAALALAIIEASSS